MAPKQPVKTVPAKKAAAKKIPDPVQPAGRNYFKQSEFPLVSLQQAQKIAAAIVDNFAGEGGISAGRSPCDWISPTSSAWQSLAGASIAYGLTAAA